MNLNRLSRWPQIANHQLPSYIFFQVSLPLVQPTRANYAEAKQNGTTRTWLGVKHLHGSSIVCGSASIASGMNEAAMDDSNVARFTALGFGLLSVVILGLTLLDHL
jgi:hypothetical protein